jgi:hypothetical protein
MWMLPASIWRIARTAPAMSEVNTPAPRPNEVPFAWAIAASQSAAVLTATAGPKSSSWLNGDAGSTSATTVGATTAPSRSPPVSTVAPAAAAALIAACTRSASPVVISEPIVVSALPGFPVRIARTFGTSASRKSPFTFGCVITRWTEMQT